MDDIKLPKLKNLNEAEDKKNQQTLEKYPKYLPLGSIILLTGGIKKLMIIGYKIYNPNDQNKIYDYLGCIYPEGTLNNDFNIVFNHENIKEIICLGLDDDESKIYHEK